MRDEAARRQDRGAPVYFLLHLPRTGGNTIAAHLQAHLGEGFWSAGRPSALAMLAGGRRYRLDGMPDAAGLRAVSGGHCCCATRSVSTYPITTTG